MISFSLSATCLDGYTERDGFCYGFIEENLGFYEAGDRCKRDGGFLVSLHSQEENDFVNGMY